ncbi:hypothetical protein BT96DRAFT_997354 [Gymnopus androsaceus JB14]|uniref:Uncharacterized protein n=1 Tax=Gymnopus androsaceus JB14 TaxID=1447944 RepID=A0A6A4HBV1_9AGAR|nr:hypothetical protein BT96DRAFT_997354 [Gymnopus androsaceus JB14]
MQSVSNDIWTYNLSTPPISGIAVINAESTAEALHCHIMNEQSFIAIRCVCHIIQKHIQHTFLTEFRTPAVHANHRTQIKKRISRIFSKVVEVVEAVFCCGTVNSDIESIPSLFSTSTNSVDTERTLS